MFWKKKVENTQKYNVRICTYEGDEWAIEDCKITETVPYVVRLIREDGHVVIPRKDIKYFEATKVFD